MVKALATFYVKEGKLDEFLKLVKELVDETNAKDKGCVEYQAFNDDANPNTVWFIEEWESREELDIHLQAPHISKLIPQITPLLEKEIDINILTAAY